MNRLLWPLLTGLFLFGCSHRRAATSGAISGPKLAELPLYRNPISADKIFVEARLADGKPRMFLIDTGSALSVLSRSVALELDLALEPRAGSLVGIGGSTSWSGAQLDSLRLGPYTVRDLKVAVGVTGVPAQVGIVPLAGIIGNDVLGQFELSVDYPGGTMQLARPGESVIPDTAVALFFNGQHPFVKTTLTARNDAGLTVKQPVLLEVDTGARGLLLRGVSHQRLEAASSQGSDTLSGVGSAHPFTRPTLRVPVAELPIGGVVIDRGLIATWIDHDRPTRRHAPELPGLVGYAALKNHRVILDYPGKRFALVPSLNPEPIVDVHSWFLRRGDPTHLERVKSLIVLGRTAEAERHLSRLARNPNDHPEAAILFARMLRNSGQIHQAQHALENVPMRAMATSGEIVAFVNTLWLQGDSEKAKHTAQLATALEPTEVASWIAAADIQLSNGNVSKARKAIAEAVDLAGDPNSFGSRRALIAWIDGDVDGALTHLRRMVQTIPKSGYPQWLYARFADTSDRRSLAAHDLKLAEDKVHPSDRPFDFAAGAWAIIGDRDRSQELLQKGLQRDCANARSDPSRDNCTAWYQVLAGASPDEAEALVRGALATQPNRSEYLDTLAMILEAQGRITEARKTSWLAALQQPTDAYLVTQALRLQHAAKPQP